MLANSIFKRMNAYSNLMRCDQPTASGEGAVANACEASGMFARHDALSLSHNVQDVEGGSVEIQYSLSGEV